MQNRLCKPSVQNFMGCSLVSYNFNSNRVSCQKIAKNWASILTQILYNLYASRDGLFSWKKATKVSTIFVFLWTKRLNFPQNSQISLQIPSLPGKELSECPSFCSPCMQESKLTHCSLCLSFNILSILSTTLYIQHCCKHSWNNYKATICDILGVNIQT